MPARVAAGLILFAAGWCTSDPIFTPLIEFEFGTRIAQECGRLLMRGFFDYTPSNRAGVVGKVSGSNLFTPSREACTKFEKSSLVDENDFQTASTSPKVLGEQRLSAQIEAMLNSFRLGP